MLKVFFAVGRKSCRSCRQNCGTTPSSASTFPTRCTAHHPSLNSWFRRRTSPILIGSSSSIAGVKMWTTFTSRGNFFGVLSVELVPAVDALWSDGMGGMDGMDGTERLRLC